MEWNHIDWELHGENVQSHWNKFTSADIEQIGGIRSVLVEKIVEHYGVNAAQAEEEISGYLATLMEPGENKI